MKKLHFIFLFITILLLSCGGPTTENKIAESKEITGDQGAPFKYWTWITYNPKMTTEQYDELFKKFKGNGMDAVLVNTLTKPIRFGIISSHCSKEWDRITCLAYDNEQTR